MAACSDRRLFRRAARMVARMERRSQREVLEPRGLEARRARHVAAYLAVVVGNVPISRVAAAAGVRHSAIQRAVARLEDARDRPDVDHRLSQLEQRFHHEIHA